MLRHIEISNVYIHQSNILVFEQLLYSVFIHRSQMPLAQSVSRCYEFCYWGVISSSCYLMFRACKPQFLCARLNKQISLPAQLKNGNSCGTVTEQSNLFVRETGGPLPHGHHNIQCCQVANWVPLIQHTLRKLCMIYLLLAYSTTTSSACINESVGLHLSSSIM